jgi:UDP-N-acetylglucosamine--N-acetylmuramyl-(pentapeptide) pyrophosphoryl-undecaprenol N-acetylglucosamine transferase
MNKKIIISAGGTGGHMFPAAAVANALRQSGYDIVLITDTRGMRYASDFVNDIIIELPVANVRQKGFFKKISSIFLLFKSLFISAKTMMTYNPVAVVGFGGYPSFPAAIAGILMLKPLFVHEQNAILGRTNSVLYRFAKKTLLSFKNTYGIKTTDKIIHTGNPIRSQILDYVNQPYPQIANSFNILVTGGSQGASIFSQIMPEMCRLLPKDMQQKLSIMHQARPEDIKTVTKLYKDYKINAVVTDFIHDIGSQIAKSHIVICRSGASTLTEISVIGRPSVYVPLPSAADDQQTINAQMAVDAGAARLIRQDDFTKSYVAGVLTEYYMHPNKLMNMAEQAKLLAIPDADMVIAKIILNSI